MSSWKHFCENFAWIESIGLGIDVSHIHNFKIAQQSFPIHDLLKEMQDLEKGAIANIDENRQVGHYWLRNPDLAPNENLKKEILSVWEEIDNFVQKIHNREINGQQGFFKNVICIGIGGSALGPQLVHKAFKSTRDKLDLYFLDNTDPDGIELLLSQLKSQLGQTLVIVTSKSGGTPETHNGMLEVKNFYTQNYLSFEKHAVCISCPGSKLDTLAKNEKWLQRFPMWDWVGGRTSISSVVGLLPMALQGIDFRQFLSGLKDIDEQTRKNENNNPAYLLAAAWYAATQGHGEKSMVIIPYKDRLALLACFLQQLIMESLGKRYDRSGKEVFQGISVYGNKGSTDQHAYVQQLRDGLDNFFVTFIEVLKDGNSAAIEIEDDVTTGDFLEGFLLGTRQALADSDRESITITLSDISPYSLGILIGLYERAVGFYASMINVNAYHQPGVEAGKKAANNILNLQKQIIQLLRKNPDIRYSVDVISQKLQSEDSVIIFKIAEHLAANKRIQKFNGKSAFDSLYQWI